MLPNRITITLLAALLSATPAAGQLVDLTVRVDGLTCMFCAFSLEKSLKSLDGVGEVAIDIETGTAVLTPTDQATIAATAVPGAVDNAGFTPRGVRVRASGRIEFQDSQASLVDSAGQALFRLAANEVLAGIKPGDETIYAITGDIVPPAADLPPGTLPKLALTAAEATTGKS